MVFEINYLSLSSFDFLSTFESIEICDLQVLDGDQGQGQALELKHDGLANAKNLK
jgi:hypothetical protein